MKEHTQLDLPVLAQMNQKSTLIRKSIITNARKARRDRDRAVWPKETSILLSAQRNGVFHLPNKKLDRINGFGTHSVPDYGGLNILFFEEEGMQRAIYHGPHQAESGMEGSENDDYMEPYLFDDDIVRGEFTAYNEKGRKDPKQRCRRIAEHRLSFPNCNEFHQLDCLEPASGFNFINSGAFREVFGYLHTVADTTENVAIKDLGYENEFDYEEYETIRMDALVAERVSSSPHTFDIYGYCGFGILSEFFHHGDIKEHILGGNKGKMKQEDLHDDLEVMPQNNFTAMEKLVLALQMAEGLADLHGNGGGLIIHDDVKLNQFLLNKDKTMLKLNDFNRAEFPLFDENRQKYCRYKNGKGHGIWRAPEEYKNQPLTEAIDVWSMGNNMYALLTGLSPLYTIKKSKDFRKKFLEGERAFIDPRYALRSAAESKLVDLIRKCWVQKPEDRITIFGIVRELNDAVNNMLDAGMTREKVLQNMRLEDNIVKIMDSRQENEDPTRPSEKDEDS